MLSTILVTGSNKGIGYEAVKLLSIKQPDTTILLGSRSVQNGNEAIEKMKSSDLSHPFVNIKVLELDITASSSLASAVEHIRSTYHTLDFLIHNSGISELNGDIKHPAIFDVNVRGAKATIDAFLPILTPHTGKITVVSSQVGSWYQHGVNDEIRKEFEDIDNVTWEKVEGWMQD
jgi:NAD(P)-dependent dehydrogenase (short-subunit alcohol dehydrogenase family)